MRVSFEEIPIFNSLFYRHEPLGPCLYYLIQIIILQLHGHKHNNLLVPYIQTCNNT